MAISKKCTTAGKNIRKMIGQLPLFALLLLCVSCATMSSIDSINHANQDSLVETELEPELEWWEELLNDPLPVPPQQPIFWLSKDVIAAAIQQAGRTWTVQPVDRLDGSYSLLDGTVQVGHIRAVIVDGTRSLHGVFMHERTPSPLAIEHTQSREDWDAFITLFTELFSNFDHTYQILNAFNTDISDLEWCSAEQPAVIYEYAVWSQTINEVQIVITLGRHRNGRDEHLSSIFMQVVAQ